MNRIKILYIVSTLRRSGPTNQLLGIISNLDKTKFDPKVLTLSPDPENNQRNEFVSANIKLDSLGLSRVNFQFKGNKILKRYIKNYNPDIIHTTGVRADNAISKLKLNSNQKHCMTIRNYAHDDYVAKYGKFLGKLFAKKSITAMNTADNIICCSKTLKKKYSKITTKNLFVIQNGVDTNKFSPPSNEEEQKKLKAKLGLPMDKTIFIVVGSLIKRKDPLTIIEAFKKANVKQDAVLLFLGDGDLMLKCRKYSNKNIILKGNVKNVNDYLKASDVYLSASKSEGLPNSVLEAGRSGLNMILTNIPQHREIFEKKSSLALFFNTEKVEQLENSIKNIILYNKNKINYDVANYIENNFSNSIMSKNYQKIYQDIL